MTTQPLSKRTICSSSWLGLFGTFLFCCVPASAQGTYTAANCNKSGISAAIASENATPADGDVIVIPAGNCNDSSWTTTLTSRFTTNVTIQGAGAESAINHGAGTTGTDQTILYDNINRTSVDTSMWILTTAPGKTLRITGIALYFTQSGPPSTLGSWAIGSTNFSSAGQLRLDHCHFSGTQQWWVALGNWIEGVADHNVFDMNEGDSNGIIVNMGNYGNDSSGNGNVSWNTASNWGSSHFFFAEDNQYNGLVHPTAEFINDCSKGGRQVFRYNTLTGDATEQAHEAQGDNRGCRATEAYMNTATYTAAQDANSMFSTRSGSILVWGNTATVKNLVSLNIDRTNTFNGGFGGLGLCGQGYSGTVNTSGTTVTYASGINFDTVWGTNTEGRGGDALLAMYINGIAYGVSFCSSNTTCTLTSSAGTTSVPYYAPSKWDQNSNSSGYACYDQPGRGQGDLITGSFFNNPPNRVNSVSGVESWPREALDPVYIFANTYTPTGDTQASCWAGTFGSGTIVDNRDVYQQFSSKCESGSFNGNVGVGQGTLLPTDSSAYPNAPNCTPGASANATTYNNGAAPGVGYWDTTNQTLYVCTATNTWTAYYTPYTYPHPLTTGTAPDSPSPPTNLSVTVD